MKRLINFIKLTFALPKWYLYFALVPLFINAFIPSVAALLWLSGCYLVLGGLVLILKK